MARPSNVMSRRERRQFRAAGCKVPKDGRWPYICCACGAGTGNASRLCFLCSYRLQDTGQLNCGHGWWIVIVEDQVPASPPLFVSRKPPSDQHFLFDL